MRARLPTISEIMTAIRIVKDSPREIPIDAMLWLTSAFHSSYDIDSRDEFDALSNVYARQAGGNDLQQDIVIAFSCLPNGAADSIVSHLIAYFAADPQFYELAHASLALSFPVTDKTVDSLFIHGNMQREVLASIISNEAIWHSDMTFTRWLAERGLPTDRDAVAQLIASTEG